MPCVGERMPCVRVLETLGSISGRPPPAGASLTSRWFSCQFTQMLELTKVNVFEHKNKVLPTNMRN